MLNTRLTFSIRCLASQFLKLNSVDLRSCRNIGTKKEVAKVTSVLDNLEDEESIGSKESATELKRNKSELFPSDYNKQHDRIPYEEPQWNYHESLKYKRRLYGKYGESSKVDPSILWPSKVELDAMREYEEVVQPFTLKKLIEKVTRKKDLKEKKILETQNLILEKARKVKLEILEFHKRVAVQKQKALEAIERKNKLVEEVKRHFGFEMDPRDERFKEMLEKLQNEERKKMKKEKQLLRDEKKKKLLQINTSIEDKQSSTELKWFCKTDYEETRGLNIRDAAGVKISDDEDDTHPNIDTPSLFRWRHQARLERMEEMKNVREIHNQKKQDHKKKMQETKEKLEEAKKVGSSLDELNKAMEELEKEAEELKIKEEELTKKEKLTPWNVDTISKSGFSKTVFNTKPKPVKEDLTDEEKEKKMKKFIKEHEKEIKEFGLLQKYDDSKRYLQEHLNLVCEETANYLVIWCINLQMEEKGNLMEHVAHQCICMQYILELSKHLDVDPRACVGSFFSRIQTADVEYKQSFDDELIAFKERIRKRAQENLDNLMKEAEEEERKARLGPGGLDPLEVLESLPEELKKCFETQDIPLLQQTLSNMAEEDARYHMKRCVDSGLWVPDGAKKNTEKADGDVP